MFRVLARLRRLRGTKLDPFGHTAERRLERELIVELEQTVETLLATLSPANVRQATDIVKLYLEIRGYGPVKTEAAARIRAQVAQALAAYRGEHREAA